MSGHSGHFLLLEEGRAAHAPSEGDSPALRQIRSPARSVPPAGRPRAHGCDRATVWGCQVYMPRVERTGAQR